MSEPASPVPRAGGSIRPARPGDGAAMADVARRLHHPTPDAPLAGRGFLISVFDAAAYDRFLAASRHSYVCVDEEDLTGFLLGFASPVLRGLQRAGAFPHDLQLIGELFAQDEAFVYVDTLAVAPRAQGRGIARALVRALWGEMRRQGLQRSFTAVLARPVPNLASRAAFESLGYRREKAVDSGGRTWDLYRVDLPRDGSAAQVEASPGPGEGS